MKTRSLKCTITDPAARPPGVRLAQSEAVQTAWLDLDQALWGKPAPDRSFSATLPDSARNVNHFATSEPHILGYKPSFYLTKGPIPCAPASFDLDMQLLGLSKPSQLTFPTKAMDGIQTSLHAAMSVESFVDQSFAALVMLGKELDQLLEGPDPDIPLIKEKRSDMRQLEHSVAMTGSHTIPLRARASASILLAQREAALDTANPGLSVPQEVRQGLLHAPLCTSKVFAGQCSDARKEADRLRALVPPKDLSGNPTRSRIPKKDKAATSANSQQVSTRKRKAKKDQSFRYTTGKKEKKGFQGGQGGPSKGKGKKTKKE